MINRINMWTCSKCGRIFKNKKQPHSCKTIPLKEHFRNKDAARKLFNELVKRIKSDVGKCGIIPIPCCVHLFGNYDFLAALPKKEGLEIRFVLDRKLNSMRLKNSAKISSRAFKNCLSLSSEKEIDEELIGWLKESYQLRGK